VALWTYLSRNWAEVLLLARDHAAVVLVAVALGTVIALGLGVATYRRPRARAIVLGVTGTMLTVPSLALYGLLVSAGLGLGWPPVVVALVLYSLLPIARNTITGLLGVDPAITESAQGMGMGRWRRLARIELPLAWPVILAGIRIATAILVGIAALGAIVNGPGLGELIFNGLRRLASPAGLPLALTGTVGVAVVGLLLDGVLLGVARMTAPRGRQAGGHG